MLNQARLSVFYVLMTTAAALQVYPLWFICGDLIQYRAISVVSGMAYGSVLPFSIPSFLGAVVCSYRIKVKPILAVWVAAYLFLHAISLLVFFVVPSKAFGQ